MSFSRTQRGEEAKLCKLETIAVCSVCKVMQTCMHYAISTCTCKETAYHSRSRIWLTLFSGSLVTLD